MKFLLLATLILTTLTNINFANAGKGRGGQYKYYQSGVIDKITNAQENAIEIIKSIPARDWNSFFVKNVNKKEIVNILSNIEFLPLERNRSREGQPLVLDYVVKDGVKTIEVLGTFLDLVLFEKYAGTIEQHLIHESLHFFGYDQDEAWAQSENIFKSKEAFSFCKKQYSSNRVGKCAYLYSENDQELVEDIRKNLISWFSESKTFNYRILLTKGWYNSDYPVEIDLSSDGYISIDDMLGGMMRKKIVRSKKGHLEFNDARVHTRIKTGIFSSSYKSLTVSINYWDVKNLMFHINVQSDEINKRSLYSNSIQVEDFDNFWKTGFEIMANGAIFILN
jgi:hypothetical protein